MRERVDAGHPNRSKLFDLKHDRGGMVDIEFIVQYCVLLHAREDAEFVRNMGNISLLRLAAGFGLIECRGGGNGGGCVSAVSEIAAHAAA